MADLGLIQNGRMLDEQEFLRPIKDRITQAREDRKRYEPTWHSNLAFAAGKHWLQWDRTQRRLAMPQELLGKDLYTADIITEYRLTALGELGSDDDRPELLLRRDDQASEDYQAQLNRAVSYGWDYEWDGDRSLEQVRQLCLDLGTAAVRCHFDPSAGDVIASNVPHKDGRPLLDLSQATSEVGKAAASGTTLQYRDVKQGRIRWEPLSSFNLLVPPGIPHESDFPWECVVQPVLLADVQAQYGELAADLKEDTDIGSVLGIDTQSQGAGYVGDLLGQGSGAKTGRLRDHVWLFCYYERPSAAWPNGRKVVLAGNQLKPLSFVDRLPYEGPNGDYRSGIAYFHWWRVTGRFFSRALVESIKDVQRGINKRRTQTNEIIDRGMPYVLVERDSALRDRVGMPVEALEIGPNERQPIVVNGIGPGPWMQNDVEAMREDAEHATGIRGPRLGDNPANVNTYGQLALLNENDQIKRDMIRRDHKRSIADLVEDSVYDMRTYWGSDREILLAGDDDQVEAAVFDATKIPPFVIVKVAQGATKPRSQGAELRKIEDLWQGALASGAVVQDPQGFLRWYKDSLDAGEALDLPGPDAKDDQADKAELENHLLGLGEDVQVQYYDPAEVHIPIHRSAQIEAELSGNVDAWQRIEQHIQQHIAAQQQAQVASQPQPQVVPQNGAPQSLAIPQSPGQTGAFLRTFPFPGQDIARTFSQ